MDVMEMLRHLTDDERAQFAKLEHVFESEGWQQIIQPLLQEHAEGWKERAAHADSWEANRLAYGKYLSFNEFAQLDGALLNEYFQKAQERATEDTVDQEIEYE